MSTFFIPPFIKSLQAVSCVIFIFFNCIVVVFSLGIGKTWAKNTTFDKINVLKILFLPSTVRFQFQVKQYI